MPDLADKDPNYWVLSIDDDPFLRLGLESALGQTKDIELFSASSASEGLKLFVELWNNSSGDATRKPSLVLLDQELQGGEKGTDLLSDIIDFCGGVPRDAAKVCMLSASQQQRDWVKAFELGAIGWIDKAAVTNLNEFPVGFETSSTTGKWSGKDPKPNTSCEFNRTWTNDRCSLPG